MSGPRPRFRNSLREQRPLRLSDLCAFCVPCAGGAIRKLGLPLAIILIVPLCVLFSLTGISISGGDNNIFTQIGFVVLIGLASKNAILIVELRK